MTAIVTWVRRRPEQSRSGKRIEEELTAEIAGLDSAAREHLRWLRRRLRVGDRLAIEVVSVDGVDTPKRRRRDDPKIAERAKRRYFERLKKEYARTPRRRARREPRGRR